MLTLPEIAELDSLACDLARRSFGGEGMVGLTDSGVVRLTLVRHDDGRGGMYQVREFSAPTYEVAALEILAGVAALSPLARRGH